MDSILQRHRKEIKDLTATITGLKKQATKKTRKNVLSKCTQLEDDLKQKQAKEISELSDGENIDTIANAEVRLESNPGSKTEDEVTPEKLLAQLELENVTSNVVLPHHSPPQSGIEPSNASNSGSFQPETRPAGKRNRAKERLAKRQAEIDRLTEEARIEASIIPDYKKIEEEGMNSAIAQENLRLYEILPDGNCLFSSVKDQLEQNNIAGFLVEQLRTQAASYMLDNRTTFEPFMYNEQTNELENIDDYAERLKETSMWGSDKEILAFSKLFDCSIKVMSFDSTLKRPNSLTINEDCSSGIELVLGYYKHSYGLGEHYNSLRRTVDGI